MSNSRLSTLISPLLQILSIAALAFGAVSLLLFALGLSPMTIAGVMSAGSLSNWIRLSHVLSIWTPLLLCASGLLFTFRAGLWNIGIEGQMVMGAISATAVLRLLDGVIPSGPLSAFAMAGGLLGGGLWGMFVGILRNRGGVNEIFGGLGLNFVAQGIILWLIFGPWKGAGIASMSETDLLARDLWLSTPSGWRVPRVALALAVSAFLLTSLLLANTRFGLRLRQWEKTNRLPSCSASGQIRSALRP